MKELTDEQFEQLRSNSQMLGRIGSYVEEFLKDDEDTVEVGVLRILAEYFSLRSDATYEALKRTQENNLG